MQTDTLNAEGQTEIIGLDRAQTILLTLQMACYPHMYLKLICVQYTEITADVTRCYPWGRKTYRSVKVVETTKIYYNKLCSKSIPQTNHIPYELIASVKVSKWHLMTQYVSQQMSMKQLVSSDCFIWVFCQWKRLKKPSLALFVCCLMEKKKHLSMSTNRYYIKQTNQNVIVCY